MLYKVFLSELVVRSGLVCCLLSSAGTSTDAPTGVRGAGEGGGVLLRGMVEFHKTLLPGEYEMRGFSSNK